MIKTPMMCDVQLFIYMLHRWAYYLEWCSFFKPFNSQDVIVNSTLKLSHINFFVN